MWRVLLTINSSHSLCTIAWFCTTLNACSSHACGRPWHSGGCYCIRPCPVLRLRIPPGNHLGTQAAHKDLGRMELGVPE